MPKNVPGELVRRLCPNGHLPPVVRAASQAYCPRCGMPPETQPSSDPVASPGFSEIGEAQDQLADEYEGLGRD